MAVKTIEFTVKAGEISPKTEQAAGVQGQHEVTEIVITVDEDLLAVYASKNVKYRLHIIDGASGFHSSGFLTLSEDNTVTYLIPSDVSNAGGVMYAHLVITEIETPADEASIETEVFMSAPARLRFSNSGVGSPSENAYRVGITGALYGAQQAAESAKSSSESATAKANEAEEAASTAVENASNAKDYSEYAYGKYLEAAGYANAAREFEVNARAYAEEAEAARDEAQTAQDSAETAQTEASKSADKAKQSYESTLGIVETHNTSTENTHQDIRDALSETTAIAKGKARSLVFDTEQQLKSWVASEYSRPDGKTTADLQIGDNLYVVELGVPDYWWDGTTIQPLGAEKPDLTDYYTKDEINAKIPTDVAFIKMTQDEYDAAYAAGTLSAGVTYLVTDE